MPKNPRIVPATAVMSSVKGIPGQLGFWRDLSGMIGGCLTASEQRHSTVKAGIPCFFPAGAQCGDLTNPPKPRCENCLARKFPGIPAPFPAYAAKPSEFGLNLPNSEPAREKFADKFAAAGNRPDRRPAEIRLNLKRQRH